MRIRRRVPAFESHLVRARLAEVDEEVRVDGEAAVRGGVELHHPAGESVGVELVVPRAVERVGEVDATAVAADLYHLRTAGEYAALRVRRAPHDAAEVHRASELRLERVR